MIKTNITYERGRLPITTTVKPTTTGEPCLNIELPDTRILRLTHAHSGQVIMTLSENGRGAVGKYRDVEEITVPENRKEVIAHFLLGQI